MSGINDKQRVLAATDIVRLIGEQVSLKRKGREYTCLCPFHEDHNPSMYVVPNKQIYHCFVCGAGGDALKFSIDYFKMGFREALQFLADRAGIQLAPPKRVVGPDGIDVPELPREALLKASVFGQNFFRVMLGPAEHGKAAREVIAKRGIAPAIVEQFGLGASPDRWDGLVQMAAAKKLGIEPFVAAGLVKARESGGGHYDSFRNRLIFPIHDALGRVVAFGGRKLREEDEPKYLNSSESILFNKSATLYGLPFASAAIREKNYAIVTEGYMDCIACHQAGVTNVVATLGTALTALGVRVLRRLCDEVILFFDGDEAGQRAADRAIEAFFAEPIEVRIATMSAARASGVTAKDPDELLKQEGGTVKFAKVIDSAVPALEYRFDRLRTKAADMNQTAKLRMVEEEIARLAEMGLDRVAPIRKRLIIQQIARLMRVSEDSVARALPSGRAARRPAATTEGDQLAAAERIKLRSAPEQMLALAVHDPVFLLELKPEERAWILQQAVKAGVDEGLATVAGMLTELASEGEEFATADLLGAIEGDAGVRAAARLTIEVESITHGDPEQARIQWDACLRDVRRMRAMDTAAKAPDWQTRISGVRAVTAQFGHSGRSLPRSGGPGGRPAP